MRISKSEKWIILAATGLLWIALTLIAGAPVFSDEFLYIDAGLRNFQIPNYGNRYFHVYLQKLFISIFPTPLDGVRVFWGLLIAVTVSLIYFNARVLTKSSTIFHGLLAVAFFFAYPLIREYSGEPAVDITAMTMTAIYLTVYLWAVRHPEKQRIALYVLGTLAFLSFKTKETTVFINILLFGFLIERVREKASLKEIWSFFSPLLIGAAVGVVLFIILDSIFLGQPFFAISPETFGSIFRNYDYAPTFLAGPASWYAVYLLDDILLPFILYLISGVLLQNSIDDNVRVIWIYPLVFVAFLSWNMLKIPWGFIERFYFPARDRCACCAGYQIQITAGQKRMDWILHRTGSLCIVDLLNEDAMDGTGGKIFRPLCPSAGSGLSSHSIFCPIGFDFVGEAFGVAVDHSPFVLYYLAAGHSSCQ